MVYFLVKTNRNKKRVFFFFLPFDMSMSRCDVWSLCSHLVTMKGGGLGTLLTH